MINPRTPRERVLFAILMIMSKVSKDTLFSEAETRVNEDARKALDGVQGGKIVGVKMRLDLVIEEAS